MDAVEDLVSLLLRRGGYCTTTSFKVEWSKEEKRASERHDCPDTWGWGTRGRDEDVLQHVARKL